MSGYLVCQIIYGAVHGDGILAASVSPSFFRIPNVWIDGHFSPYLYPFRINAHLAQELTHPVLAYFRAVDIKQYGKSAATFGILVFCIFSHVLVF